MSYKKAIELAGAKVIESKRFGDYQGTWWAHVEYKGQTGWVMGAYGSCSSCDAWEREFSWDGHVCDGVDENDEDIEDTYPATDFEFVDGCTKCAEVREQIIAFGLKYLDLFLSQKEAEKIASKNIDWDLDADDVLAFVRSKRH